MQSPSSNILWQYFPLLIRHCLMRYVLIIHTHALLFSMSLTPLILLIPLKFFVFDFIILFLLLLLSSSPLPYFHQIFPFSSPRPSLSFLFHLISFHLILSQFISLLLILLHLIYIRAAIFCNIESVRTRMDSGYGWKERMGCPYCSFWE